MTLATPLALPTPDNVPIRLLIVLITSQGGRPHLELLAQAAHLANLRVADGLCQARDATQVIDQLRNLELVHGWGGLNGGGGSPQVT